MGLKKSLGIQLRGNKENPYHKSIGAVVVGKQGRVALVQEPSGIVTLPRETQYLEESPAACVRRGAKEELGLTVEARNFIGTLLVQFSRPDGTLVHKSTDYFVAKYIGKASVNKETDKVVVWLPIEEAKHKLLAQGDVDKGANEAEILQRLK